MKHATARQAFHRRKAIGTKCDMTPIPLPMKSIIYCVAALLLGLTIGWYIGRDREMKITTEAAQQGLEQEGLSSTLEATRAVLAINLITSGDNQGAVRLLCRPIADFYYGIQLDKNEQQHAKVRRRIEKLASTNRFVADFMTNYVGYVNGGYKDPLPDQ
jgi:hypothetical protein